MIDLKETIKPKSDQLNSDDLIAGPMMLEITGIRIVGGDQPVCIDWRGGQGRPYKPCKSMRRLLIVAWGDNGENYIGRKITVFNDIAVKWAGKEVGGIRISHMSHIEKDIRIALTESRGRKASHLVKKIETEQKNSITKEIFEDLSKRIAECKTMADLQIIASEIKHGNYNDEVTTKLGLIYKEATNLIMEVK